MHIVDICAPQRVSADLCEGQPFVLPSSGADQDFLHVLLLTPLRHLLLFKVSAA